MTTLQFETTDRHTRQLGLACAASGLVMTPLAIVLGIPLGSVPESQWSYPHAASIFLGEAVLLTIAHLLSAAGFVGLLRQSPGGGRLVRVGLVASTIGLLGLSVAELGSGLIGSRDVDSAPAGVVGAVFGVASLTFAVGALVAGIALTRSSVAAGRWVVATGAVILLLVTPANISGDLALRQFALLLWSLLFIPLGLVVSRRRIS